MAARAKCIRELWYCVEYRDGTRFKECFGRGPNAKGMAQEAAERVNLERAMEKRGLLRTSTGTRFDAYAEEWLRDVIEPHKKSGTVRLYKQLFRDHLKPHFGHLALSEITAREIKAFIAAKLRELRKRDADDVGRARARYTVRNMVAVLRTILYHAVDVDELLPTNPAAKFGKKFFEGSSTDTGIHVEVYEEAEIAPRTSRARSSVLVERHRFSRFIEIGRFSPRRPARNARTACSVARSSMSSARAWFETRDSSR